MTATEAKAETQKPGVKVMTMLEAINDALRTEMRNDDRVVVFGEDVGKKGGVFGATAGLHVRICGPAVYSPDPAVTEAARAIADRTGGSVGFGSDPDEACKGADFLATDVWTSMGQEGQEAARTAAMLSSPSSARGYDSANGLAGRPAFRACSTSARSA